MAVLGTGQRRNETNTVRRFLKDRLEQQYCLHMEGFRIIGAARQEAGQTISSIRPYHPLPSIECWQGVCRPRFGEQIAGEEGGLGVHAARAFTFESWRCSHHCTFAPVSTSFVLRGLVLLRVVARLCCARCDSLRCTAPSVCGCCSCRWETLPAQLQARPAARSRTT
eukprot:3412780-Pleurochrysis_carterae.AAC.1